jgi:hypothetical protein
VFKFPFNHCEVIKSPPRTTLHAVPPAFTRWHQNQDMSSGTWHLYEWWNNTDTRSQCA